MTLRAPGSLTSGEIDAVLGVGPNAPATKRGDSGVEYFAQAAVASLAAASLVWWPDLLVRGEEHRREHRGLLDELAADVTGDDPVKMSLVATLNRPEGNVTGIFFHSGADLLSKQLELLREVEA